MSRAQTYGALATVDRAEILERISAGEYVPAIAAEFDRLAQGGGFILSPGCTLPYTTPGENVSALIEAAKEYGQYT